MKGIITKPSPLMKPDLHHLEAGNRIYELTSVNGIWQLIGCHDSVSLEFNTKQDAINWLRNR